MCLDCLVLFKSFDEIKLIKIIMNSEKANSAKQNGGLPKSAHIWMNLRAFTDLQKIYSNIHSFGIFLLKYVTKYFCTFILNYLVYWPKFPQNN